MCEPQIAYDNEINTHTHAHTIFAQPDQANGMGVRMNLDFKIKKITTVKFGLISAQCPDFKIIIVFTSFRSLSLPFVCKFDAWNFTKRKTIQYLTTNSWNCLKRFGRRGARQECMRIIRGRTVALLFSFLVVVLQILVEAIAVFIIMIIKINQIYRLLEFVYFIIISTATTTSKMLMYRRLE